MEEYKNYNFNLIRSGKSKAYYNNRWVKAAAYKYAIRNGYIYIKRVEIKDRKGIFFAWEYNEAKTKITYSIIKID